MIAPIFRTSAVKQFPRECPASHPTGIGSVSTFAIWSWIPSATSGTRIRKIKGAAQRILWCRMRLWDSEWPRNWGLGWEGRLMVMLNARRPFSYRKLQFIPIGPPPHLHEKISPLPTCIAISHWSTVMSVNAIHKSMIQIKITWCPASFFLLSGHNCGPGHSMLA